MFIDAHCHLTGLSDGELEETLDRAKTAGVTALIAVGAMDGLDGNTLTLAIARARAEVRCALAVHPHDARLLNDANFEELTGLIADNADVVKAVGETGLDFHYGHSPAEAQRAAFRRFIGLARRVAMPLVIHDRECGTECPDILREEGAVACGGMAHCFSGDVALAKRYLELGFYVSFSGIVSFKNAETVREAARFVPGDRLLIETDSPYLAPVPYRGRKNEPAYVRFVAEALASIRGETLERIAEATAANARRLFGLAV